MELKTTTARQQMNAIDVVIRAALTNDQAPLTSGLMEILGSLPREAGLRVANVMVMLAGKAVADTEDWRTLLQEHLAGATDD